ncbi:uncharacterized protein aknad1 isoform X2 [Brachyhypopomus gauderio]|uniref:uncharacterized protein aknad1 isoform X2 n=1 Tax=Brachyhypopomus gauderio TaxID=698409 RepID=UPI004041DFB6
MPSTDPSVRAGPLQRDGRNRITGERAADVTTQDDPSGTESSPSLVWERHFHQTILVDISEDDSLHLSDLRDSFSVPVSRGSVSCESSGLSGSDEVEEESSECPASVSEARSHSCTRNGGDRSASALRSDPERPQRQRQEDDTSDEEQEELPYDGGSECHLIHHDTCPRTAVLHTLRHTSAQDSDVLQTVADPTCHGDLSGPPSGPVGQVLDSVPQFLLRYFSQEELLNCGRLIEAETLPEVSLLESVDETVLSRSRDSLNTKPCVSHSEEKESSRAESHRTSETSVSKPGSAETASLRSSNTAEPVILSDGRDQSDSSVVSNSVANAICNSTSVVLLPKDEEEDEEEDEEGAMRGCSGGAPDPGARGSWDRMPSSGELKYGQGQVHYPRPDFSKVAPRVKIPKGKTPAKPGCQSPAMDRTHHVPGIVGKSPASCTADVISRVLEDTVWSCAFRDEGKLDQYLQAEYDRLLAKYAEDDHLIIQMKTRCQTLSCSEPLLLAHRSIPGESQNVNISHHQSQNVNISRFESLNVNISRLESQNVNISPHETQNVNISRHESQRLTSPPNPHPSSAGLEEQKNSEVWRSLSELKSQTEGHRLTTELTDIITQFKDKVDEFKTSISDMSMTLEEQRMVFRTMLEAQDQLERNYMNKKEEHRALEMQRYMGYDRNTGEFDPDRQVEGEIFWLGMQLEVIKEQIDNNALHDCLPASRCTATPPHHEEHGEIITTPPHHCEVITTPPHHCEVITTPPHHNEVITTPPHHCEVITTPPHHCEVITTPPRHSEVITTPPHHCEVITTPPRHSEVITTPPCHSEVITTPPHHCEVINTPHHFEVITPPHHCEVITTPPHHCEVITPPHHCEVITPAHHCEVITTPPHHGEVITTPPNHCEVITPPHHCEVITTPPHHGEVIASSACQLALHKEFLFSISSSRTSAEEEEHFKTNDEEPTVIDSALALIHINGQSSHFDGEGEAEDGSMSMAGVQDEDFLERLPESPQRTPYSPQDVGCHLQDSPEPYTNKIQRHVSPETDSGLGTSDLSRPATGLSHTQHNADSLSPSDDVTSMSMSTSENYASNLQMTMATWAGWSTMGESDPGHLPNSVQNIQWNYTIQNAPVRLHFKAETPACEGATLRPAGPEEHLASAPAHPADEVQASHGHAPSWPHPQLTTPPHGHTLSSCPNQSLVLNSLELLHSHTLETNVERKTSVFSSDIIRALKHEVSHLKRALEGSLGYLHQPSHTNTHEKRLGGQPRPRHQHRHRSSRCANIDIIHKKVEDWMSSDMKLNGSTGSDRESDTSSSGRLRPAHRDLNLRCRTPSHRRPPDYRGSSLASLESLSTDMVQSRHANHQRPNDESTNHSSRANVGSTNHSTIAGFGLTSHRKRVNKRNECRPQGESGCVMNRLDPLPRPLHEPLQINYDSCYSFSSVFKAQHLQSGRDSALLSSNVSLLHTAPCWTGGKARTHRHNKEMMMNRTLDEALEAVLLLKQTTERMAESLRIDLAMDRLYRK